MIYMKLEEAIQEIRKQEKRKFTQTIDLNMNFKNIDVKRPENRFSKDIQLPNGRGKEVKIGIISDSIPDAIGKIELEELPKDKRKMRQIINDNDYFLCEPALMATVGKFLGKFLGPKGKMPKPLMPNVPIDKISETLKKSVSVRVLEAPTVSVPIGTEEMSDDELKKNAETVINEVKELLPNGVDQIKTIILKTTMGKPVNVDA